MGKASNAKKARQPVKWTDFRRTVPVQPYEFQPGEDMWQNSRYVVFRRLFQTSDNRGMIHLSIRRQDRLPIHDWRDLQRVKNELAGPNWEACELYPAESRVHDSANQFHLWCFQPPFMFPFGFQDRLVNDSDLVSGAAQRPLEPDVERTTDEEVLARRRGSMAGGVDLLDELIKLGTTRVIVPGKMEGQS